MSIEAVAGYKIKFFEFKNFLINFLCMDPIQNSKLYGILDDIIKRNTNSQFVAEC